jgi:hypothetical protein
MSYQQSRFVHLPSWSKVRGRTPRRRVVRSSLSLRRRPSQDRKYLWSRAGISRKCEMKLAGFLALARPVAVVWWRSSSVSGRSQKMFRLEIFRPECANTKLAASAELTDLAPHHRPSRTTSLEARLHHQSLQSPFDQSNELYTHLRLFHFSFTYQSRCRKWEIF